MPPDPSQPQTQPTQASSPSVDPTALALSRAIRSAEGGDYTNTSADNGTSAGAYSWNNYVDGKSQKLDPGQPPANFVSAAKQFGLDPTDFSQTNQDHVAYEQVKAQLDAGHSQSEVASWWNSGSYDSAGNKGYNSQLGVSYDTPSYVQKVQKAYEQEVQTPGSTLPQNPSASQSDNTYNPTPFSNPLPGSFNFSGSANTPPPAQTQPITPSSIGKGALGLLDSEEKPFLGLAAAPFQLLAKGLGQKDPFSTGIGGGQAPETIDPLANTAGGVAEQEAGNAAQVGSYFVPGGDGVLPTVLGGTAMGALQGAGSAMSSQKNLTDVATQGAEGAALGGVTTGVLSGLGSVASKAGEALTGEGTQKALQALKDAYGSALNLNASERGFEARSGKDLAQVLMDNGVNLGRNEANNTLDASEAIPKLQKALDPLNEQANKLISNPSLNQNSANFIPLSTVKQSVLEQITGSNIDSLEKESSIAQAEKLFAATQKEYGDVVSPQVGEKIKQGLQSTVFKKALTSSDALQGNVKYLASNQMRKAVEAAVAGSPEGDKYAQLNSQRSDLVDAVKRLTKLDGVRLVKGGRLGGMAGNIVGSIAGASSGLGPLGTLAGDFFGGKAADFLNNPATKIAIARAKVGASGVLPKVLGGAAKPVGETLSGTGGVLSRLARPAGLMANIAANTQNSR